MAVWLLRLYRWVVSPAKTILFGSLGRCRFEPSCSAYAIEAISGHGFAHGSYLGLRRLLRCHPWGGCGSDPVPPPATSRSHWRVARWGELRCACHGHTSDSGHQP